MKIFIFLPISNNNNSGCGGGNQFLNGLKNEFKRMNKYTENLDNATVVLFNSHHHLQYINIIKSKLPHVKIFHRIDGLHQLWRGESGKNIDNIVQDFANNYADGVIFQSKWSKQIYEKHNIIINKKYNFIHNAADNNIFKKRKKNINGKIELITTCWSCGDHKGIEYYMYLDKKLDFERFNYTYIGKIPKNFKFKNIKHFEPMNKNNLSKYIQNCDIFISAVKIDAASNSITEALTCGLPVLYLDSGGNKEIVKDGGIAFNDINNIINKLDILVSNYDTYNKNICVPTISEIANKYIHFFNSI